MKTTTRIKIGFAGSHNGLGSTTFSEVLLKRRSIRKYLDKPVEIELLKDIIHESALAPSAGNEQPWKFIVVQNAQVLRKISEACKENLFARIAAIDGWA